MSTTKELSREQVIQALLSKDDMQRNASPKLLQSIIKAYRSMNNEELEELFWFCYHENIIVF